MSRKHVLMFCVIGFCGLGFGLFVGCGKPPATAPDSKVANEGHSHDGWWCDAHGVPEEICALCNTKLVSDFKAKDDWCKEHERPDSQCFVCHPEKQAEFAAQYEAKYGKQPPKLEHGEAKHNHGDHAKT